MGSTLHRHHESHQSTGVQRVAQSCGLVFLTFGVVGLVLPDLLGLHLSFTHNVIFLITGILAILTGISRLPARAGNFCLLAGTIYSLFGLAGFVLGQPGYPAVGHLAPDPQLLRVVPNVLEFGVNDHAVHGALGLILLISGLVWKVQSENAARALVRVQGRTRQET